jgi:iron complex outermembrane receptor protein
MTPYRFSSLVRGSALAVLALSRSTAFAETATSGSPTDRPYQLEKVTILGSLDPVPAGGGAVTRVSGEELTARGILSPRDLTAVAPNLAVFDANGDRTPRFSLRGLRENNFSYGESAVAIYVDDVPYSDLFTRGLPLFDLAGGEFFRGPQGTLFGANRPGGVLNLYTRLPGNETQGRGTVSYGNYDAVTAQGGVSGSLIKDTLFLGVSGLYAKRDGYFYNAVTGTDADPHETLAGRVQLRWLPTETLDFTLGASANRFRDGGVITRPLAAPGDPYDVKLDQNGFDRQDSHTYSLRAAWTGEKVRAISVTTRRDWRQDVGGDFDYAEFFSGNNFPLNGLAGFSSPDVQQWSQELRLESVDKDNAFKWNAGAYWAQLTTDAALGYNYGPLAPFVVSPKAPTSGTDLTSGRSRNDSTAIFAQATYTVAENLDLNAGLRFEHEDRRGNRDHTFSGFPIPGVAPQTFHGAFNSLQPRAGLTYHLTKDVTAWASFTTGFQPGGFSSSSDNAAVAKYDAAESLHYEVGVSAKLLEGKLLASASGFWIETRDYQVYRPVVTFGGGGAGLDFYITNADKVRTLGGELELRAVPCEWFETRLAGGYQNAEFRNFTTPGPFGQNLAGKEVNFVPQLTLDASATAHCSRCGVYATLGVTVVGDWYLDEPNTTRQPAYALLYARAGWQNKNFGVSVFGRNLTDTHYYANALDLGPRAGFNNGFFVGTPGDPMVVGVEVSAKF